MFVPRSMRSDSAQVDRAPSPNTDLIPDEMIHRGSMLLRFGIYEHHTWLVVAVTGDVISLLPTDEESDRFRDPHRSHPDRPRSPRGRHHGFDRSSSHHRDSRNAQGGRSRVRNRYERRADRADLRDHIPRHVPSDPLGTPRTRLIHCHYRFSFVANHAPQGAPSTPAPSTACLHNNRIPLGVKLRHRGSS